MMTVLILLIVGTIVTIVLARRSRPKYNRWRDRVEKKGKPSAGPTGYCYRNSFIRFVYCLSGNS
jgi:hypothetical protein